MLYIILGRAGFGKTSFVRRKLLENAKNGISNQILIVPEQFSFESEKALLNFPDRLGHGIEVLSFTRLCTRVFKLYGGIAGLQIDDASRSVFMAAAISQLYDSLSLYKKIAKRPEFLKSMLDSVCEFKNCAITPQQINRTIALLPDSSLKDRMKDISLIYSGYDSLIKEDYCDPLDNLSRLCKKLDEHPFFEDKTVFIDAFKGFTGQQLKVLEKIITKAQDVYITFCTDNLDESEMNVFSNVRNLANSIIAIAKKQGVKVAPLIHLDKNLRHCPELRVMESRIFSGKDDESPDNSNNSIRVYEAVNKYDEADFVAKTVSRLVREKGLHFNEISVIARDITDYTQILEEAFDKRGIPCFIDSRRPVDNQPIMIMLRSAFNILTSSFSTESILTYIKCGLLDISDKSIYDLENYVFIWKINGRVWKDEFTFNPNGMSNIFGEDEIEKLKEINITREKIITPLLKFENDVKSAETAVDFAKALLFLFESQEVNKHLEALAKQCEHNGELENADLIYRSWNMFISALDKISALSDIYKVDRDGFFDMFRTLISLMDMGTLPKGIDQVSIGSASRTRPAEPKAVFIIGANDGKFPSVPSSSGLLTDFDRAKLIELDLPVTDPNESGIIEESFLFYSSACSPSDNLFISYVVGKNSYPSPPVISIIETFDIKKESFDCSENYIDSKATAFEYLNKNYNTEIPEVYAIKEFFNSNYYPPYDTLKRILTPCNNKLSEDTSTKLFGKNITVSPTSVERFHKCRFCYFCQHGIRAKKLRAVDLDVLNKGTLVHHVLEQMLNKYTSKGLIDISEEIMKNDISILTDNFIRDNMGGFKNKPKKFLYQLNRIKSLIWLVIEHMSRELADSKFITAECELPIGRKGDFRSIEPFSVHLPSGGSINITGVVDRLDTFKDENTVYFRIVDYKTGLKTFKPDNIYYGIGLQMLIYLYAVENHLSKTSNNCIPSGVLYMPARSVKTSNDDNFQSELDKSLKMKGLILDNPVVTDAMDPQKSGLFVPLKFKKDGELSAVSSLASYDFFKKTKQKIEQLLTEMGESLHGGDFSADPLDAIGENGCDYCEFFSVCPNGKDGIHRKVPKLSKEEIDKIYKGGDINEIQSH